MIGESLVSSNEDGLDKLAKHARGVLVALAFLQLAGGVIYYVIGGIAANEFGIILASGLMFGGLAVWARKNPLPAVSAGCAIWLLSIASAAIANPASLFEGLLVKALIVGGFINGISTAMTYNKMKKNLASMTGR